MSPTKTATSAKFRVTHNWAQCSPPFPFLTTLHSCAALAIQHRCDPSSFYLSHDGEYYSSESQGASGRRGGGVVWRGSRSWVGWVLLASRQVGGRKVVRMGGVGGNVGQKQAKRACGQHGVGAGYWWKLMEMGATSLCVVRRQGSCSGDMVCEK
ncbi:hypothetical protein EDB89DRAFT_1909285 [Lactarius sanguifluus]|nr:hypothetical protein EDB89DRAFT_1909285 [Lactarius sanguifluus]